MIFARLRVVSLRGMPYINTEIIGCLIAYATYL